MRISGDDIPDLKAAALAAWRPSSGKPRGVVLVRSDFRQPLQGVDVKIRKDEANRLGVPRAMFSYSLMTGTKGLPAATVWEGDYPLQVRLKFEGLGHAGAADRRTSTSRRPCSAPRCSLRQLAELRPSWSEGDIVRRNGVRTLSVLAEVERACTRPPSPAGSNR